MFCISTSSNRCIFPETKPCATRMLRFQSGLSTSIQTVLVSFQSSPVVLDGGFPTSLAEHFPIVAFSAVKSSSPSHIVSKWFWTYCTNYIGLRKIHAQFFNLAWVAKYWVRSVDGWVWNVWMPSMVSSQSLSEIGMICRCDDTGKFLKFRMSSHKAFHPRSKHNAFKPFWWKFITGITGRNIFQQFFVRVWLKLCSNSNDCPNRDSNAFNHRDRSGY